MQVVPAITVSFVSLLVAIHISEKMVTVVGSDVQVAEAVSELSLNKPRCARVSDQLLNQRRVRFEITDESNIDLLAESAGRNTRRFIIIINVD